MVTKTETAFGLVVFLVIIIGAGLLIGTEYFGSEEAQVSQMTTVLAAPQTYIITQDIEETEDIVEEPAEAPVESIPPVATISYIDPEQEIEYMYIKIQSVHQEINQVENDDDLTMSQVNAIKADINDVEEMLYDLMARSAIDEVEMDQLYEELDNARSRASDLEHDARH